MLKVSALMAIISVTLATAGQLLLKSGMEKVGFISGKELSRPMQLAVNVLKTPQVVFGLAVFAASAAMWLVVLSRVPLSFAYPFVGVTYVLTTLFAKFVLHESVPALRWAGLLLIIVGILAVGLTSSHDTPVHGGSSPSASVDN